MRPEGPLRLIRVCEDRAQADAIAVVAERAMAEAVPWYRELREDGHESSVVTWTCREGSPGWETLTQVAADAGRASGARGRFRSTHGHFPGRNGPEPGLPDATLFRKVFAAVRRSLGEPAPQPGRVWLVVGRDTDGKRDLHAAWAQATADAMGASPAFTLLLAAFHPEAEAWYLAGFTATDEQERRELETLRRELGFDPSLKPHQCSAGRGGPRGSKRDAKDILRRLAPSADRVKECLAAPLDHLAERGANAGAAAWIAAARDQLAPHL